MLIDENDTELSAVIKKLVEDKDREITNKLKSDSFTTEQLIKILEQIEPKTIFLNRKTHHLVLNQLDFVPTNIIVNDYLPDNQAIIMTEKQIKEMGKVFFKPKMF